MIKRWLVMTACLFTALIFVLDCAAAWDQSGWYENEWNYVSDSMDVSEGMPRDATGVLGRIQRNGTLRVAVDPRYPPQIFRDCGAEDGTGMGGADIRLAKRIAERMGVRLEFIQLESTQILSSLTEDQCDLAVSALTFTPGRALSSTMSKGYYFPESESGIGFLVRQGSGIEKMEDLDGRVIAAQSNSLAESIGVAYVTNYLEFKRTSSAQAVYEAVVRGRADVGIVSISTAKNFIENNPERELELVEGMVFIPETHYRGSRVAAKKGENQLIAFVNGVIDEVIREGAYEAWIREAREQGE